MAFIQLERRFIVWNEKEGGDPEDMSFMLASPEGLTWEDLLKKHRVVILAEAGSGKSTELAEQARITSEAGRYTFFATVQDVGRLGLDRALDTTAARALDEWRSSEQPAWFFLDSVDEAKARDVRLDDALREIAAGIAGAASRSHVILSGRHTDWEFRSDLEKLEQWIAMPREDEIAPPIDSNELLISVIRRDRRPQPSESAEMPLVVVMGALELHQVKAFARGKGVDDVGSFVHALESSNLWSFARRPLDLGWLVDYWRSRGAFGPLANMLEESLRKRLQEHDLHRARKDAVDSSRAMTALERIGAGLVLQGMRDIAIPDSSTDLMKGQPALDLADILPEWSSEDRAKLINRAVFVPGTAGFARLYNDNEGSVRSFLTSRWLKRLMEANCPTAVVRDLLFAVTYGMHVVIPSMRQTAAWLSIWSPDIAREVIVRDPRLLMDSGDPARLTLSVREQALKAVVLQYCDNEHLETPNRDSLKRFALPDVASCIRELWVTQGGSPAVRKLLLLMIWLGELNDCADLAVAATFENHADRYSQIISGRALMAVASDTDKMRYANYIKDNAKSTPIIMVWDCLEALFPAFLSVDDLLIILKSVNFEDRTGGLGLEDVGPKLTERLASPAQIEQLLAGLIDMMEAPIVPPDNPESSRDEHFLSTIEAAGKRLLELSVPTQAPTLAIDAALRLGDSWHDRPRRRSQDGAANLLRLLAETPQRRRLARIMHRGWRV